VTVVLALAAVLGEVLLPAEGAAGLLSRIAVVAAVPIVLAVSGFLRPTERVAIAQALR